MTPPRFSIFIHIPKTAGTAVARILEEAYPQRIFYDYGTERNLRDARTPPLAAVYNRDSLMRHYRMIYGHFHHLKYSEIYYNAEFLSMVREPVSRAISHYYHLARYADPTPHPIAELVKSGEWNIIDLHRRNRSLTNVLGMYFEGRDVRDFSFILTQERLFDSLRACAEKLRMQELGEIIERHSCVPEINARPDVPLLPTVQTVTDEHRSQLEDLLAGETLIYRQVQEAFPC